MSAITDPAVLAALDFLNLNYETLGRLTPARHSSEEQHAIQVLAAYIRANPPQGEVSGLVSAARELVTASDIIGQSERHRKAKAAVLDALAPFTTKETDHG